MHAPSIWHGLAGPITNYKGDKLMDKIWLKSYPPGVPAEINAGEFASLADLFERSVAKFAARTAYVNMGKIGRAHV